MNIKVKCNKQKKGETKFVLKIYPFVQPVTTNPRFFPRAGRRSKKERHPIIIFPIPKWMNLATERLVLDRNWPVEPRLWKQVPNHREVTAKHALENRGIRNGRRRQGTLITILLPFINRCDLLLLLHLKHRVCMCSCSFLYSLLPLSLSSFFLHNSTHHIRITLLEQPIQQQRRHLRPVPNRLDITLIGDLAPFDETRGLVWFVLQTQQKVSPLKLRSTTPASQPNQSVVINITGFTRSHPLFQLLNLRGEGAEFPRNLAVAHVVALPNRASEFAIA